MKQAGRRLVRWLLTIYDIVFSYLHASIYPYRLAFAMNKRHYTRRAAVRSMLIGWLNVQSLTNKTDAVSELVVDRSMDVLALTETWHSASDDVRLRLATPEGYSVVEVARGAGRGGGVVVIFNKQLRCSQIPLPSCDTFEAICGPVVLLNIYQPGSSARFYDELTSVLEVLVFHCCPVVVGGDINVRVNDVDDNDARRRSDLLATFDIVQHVNAPTQVIAVEGHWIWS